MLKRFQVVIMMFFVNIILTIISFNLEIDLIRFIASIWGGLALMALYPIFSLIFKINLPESLLWIYYIHIFVGMYLGTALDGFSYFWWLDLLAHGFFGIEGCLFAYLILVRSGLIKHISKPLFLLFLASFTLALASIWEIYEYLFDILTNSDSQRVGDHLNPLTDTMEDILITLAGILITFIFLFIDKFHKYYYTKKIFKDFDNKNHQKYPKWF